MSVQQVDEIAEPCELLRDKEQSACKHCNSKYAEKRNNQRGYLQCFPENDEITGGGAANGLVILRGTEKI